MSRSAVPPPVTAVMDAASAWLPARLAEVERRLAEIAGGHGPELGSRGRGDAGRRAASGCGRCWS